MRLEFRERVHIQVWKDAEHVPGKRGWTLGTSHSEEDSWFAWVKGQENVLEATGTLGAMN